LHAKLSAIDTQKHTIYSAAIPIVGGASIGAHLRHILDFYSSLYFGVKKGKINYDARQRNPKIESDLGSGLLQLSTNIEQLAELSRLDNIPVKIFSAIQLNEELHFEQSNLIRELQSVHSHTTHHMAIIAIILKLNNMQVDEDFGKAPSTIQYEQELKSMLATNTPNRVAL